ncbi:MAG: CRISPR-associated endonuclease Cas1 [Lewinellaceae bacterium]|nr:CRISPR-associated endonuclease Cas1 [Phaeodactylibacter sp.]MCB9039796.1 CRISPR-associated endonuclease Cas1 [Lewinellaceae bacterium]
MQLYLNTYGTYLHIKDALFEVRVPQEGGGHQRHQFAATKVTSIIMTTSAALSTDAIQLALQNNIDIIFADSSGFPLGRVWHSKLGSTTRIRKRQLEASIGPEGVRRTVQWLSAKLGNQMEFIKGLKKHRSRMADFLDDKAARIGNLQQSIRLQEDAPSVDAIAETLRGLEGTAGRLYFEALSQALPEEHRFAGRSFRPALDPFNTFLNYGYGVLYNRVEKALMIAGLDPYVGFLHRDDYNQKSMVFDYIEPYRIHVETVVFRLFSAKKVNQSHTEPLANGLTLVKEGKQLLIEKLNDYLEVQTIRYNGRNQTRANGLQMDAHRFANELIGK